MKQTLKRLLARRCALLLVTALTACGGGGGEPDSRNGDYTLYAADAHQYTLSLDFDAGTFHLTGTDTDSTGAFAAAGSGFAFTPAGTAPAVNNAKFSQFGDTVVGGLRLGGGIVPFVASRSFVDSIADAAGTYKFLGVTYDTSASAPAPVNNIIYTGEIVAPATFRYCNDSTIYMIGSCPASSVATATLTVSGPDFTADFGASGKLVFRVARIGDEKVFLRASQSGPTSRRFVVGVDMEAGFSSFTGNGVNSEDEGTATKLTATALDSTLTSEAKAKTTRTGTAGPAGVPGLQGVVTSSDGNFFFMRTADLAFVFAARNNPVHPGYVEILRK